jgi:hypothetical protein
VTGKGQSTGKSDLVDGDQNHDSMDDHPAALHEARNPEIRGQEGDLETKQRKAVNRAPSVLNLYCLSSRADKRAQKPTLLKGTIF